MAIRQFGIPRYFVMLVGGSLLLTTGCADDRSHTGPKESEPLPAVEVGEDAPVDLTYVCGNRFIVSNAHAVPITVTYRVSGGEEEETAEVGAAPAEDPAVSEQMFETRTGGAVQLFLDGKPLVARANGGTPCTPVVPAPSFAVASGTESGQWTAPVSWPIVAVHMALLPSGRVLAIGRGTPAGLGSRHRCVYARPQSRLALLCGARAASRMDGCSSPAVTSPTAMAFRTSPSSPEPITPGRPALRWPMDAGIRRPLSWATESCDPGRPGPVGHCGHDSGSVEQRYGPATGANSRFRTILAPSSPPTDRSILVAHRRDALSLAVGRRRVEEGTGATGRARDYGSAVMYDDGKILYAGGGGSTNTAETINLNETRNRMVTLTGSMAFARRHPPHGYFPRERCWRPAG